jgi:hypothetical protein
LKRQWGWLLRELDDVRGALRELRAATLARQQAYDEALSSSPRARH